MDPIEHVITEVDADLKQRSAFVYFAKLLVTLPPL